MPPGLTVAVLLLGSYAVLHVRHGPPRSGSAYGPVSGPAAGQPAGITDVPLMLDLIGAMLDAGASVDQALGVLAESCTAPVGRKLLGVRGALELGAGWTAAWDAGPAPPGAGERRSIEELRTALGFAVATGAPSAAIVHARAGQLRRRQNRSLERRAAALGVRLVIPLGVCALPAFACLGIVPVVLALLPSP
jgi:hypothetical protein